jgi:hypothetical protein
MADTTDSSGIPLLGPVIDLLNNVLSNAGRVEDLARAVDQVEQNTWQNALNLAGWSFGLFGGILGSLGDLLKSLGKLLEGLFVNVIWGFLKNLLQHIRDWITALRNWIKVHVAALQQIQKQLDAARARQMRLMLDVIQRMRKILVPFRLLHLGFAQKLDSYLVGLESDIGQKWAKLIAHNNQVLGVLNAIIDPRQLMRPGHTLGSLGAMVAAVHGAIGAADLRTLFCMGPAVGAQPLVQPWATTRAVIFNEWRTNSGDYATFVAQRDQALQQYAIDLGTDTIK